MTDAEQAVRLVTLTGQTSRIEALRASIILYRLDPRLLFSEKRGHGFKRPLLFRTELLASFFAPPIRAFYAMPAWIHEGSAGTRLFAISPNQVCHLRSAMQLHRLKKATC